MSTTVSALLEEKIPIFLNTKMEQPSKAKIQKVQPYLRERKDFVDYYFPKLVSIGPIHHHKNSDNNNLEQGEQYKRKWALMYVQGMDGSETTETKVKKLLKEILLKIKDLRRLYTEDAIQGHDDDEELAWMFFIDGCAVLHFMEKASFTSSDGVEIKVDQQVIVQQDLLLLENQLPYRVLKLLSNNNDAKLRRCKDKFLQMHHMIPDQVSITISNKPEEECNVATPQENEPTHLLDLLRSAILQVEFHTHSEQKERERKHLRRHHLLDHLRSNFFKSGEEKSKKNKNNWPTHRNIQELKTSGIGIRPDENARLTDITFRGRKIFLSKLMVDDFTAPTFLNMIAYEMCPDFENGYEISSYMSFMNSLIDHADDVKELRRVGVLHNSLGSDEVVANIFNTVSTDMVLDTRTYVDVRNAIEKHYRNKCNTRMTEVYRQHFRSPWAIIGLFAAFLGLFLTIVQTCLAFRQ